MQFTRETCKFGGIAMIYKYMYIFKLIQYIFQDYEVKGQWRTCISHR